MIIAFTGYAGSGKDTSAQYLVKRHFFKSIAFADALREMASVIDPVVGTRIVDYELTPTGIEARSIHVTYNYAIEHMGYDVAKEAFPEIRRFLQVLGTDALRKMVDEDIWIKLALDGISRGERIAISDLRFKNEARAVKERNGYIVRLIRGKRKSDHPSEKEVEEIDADWTIVNDKSKKHLYTKIDNFMTELQDIGAVI